MLKTTDEVDFIVGELTFFYIFGTGFVNAEPNILLTN